MPTARRVFLSPDGRLRSGWRVAALLAAFGLATLALAVAVGVAVGVYMALSGKTGAPRLPLAGSRWLALGADLVLLPVLMGLVWVFRRFLDRRSYRSLGFWADRRLLPDLGAGLVLGAAMMALVAGAVLAAGWGRWAPVPAADRAGAGALIFAILGFAAAAMVEELLMRGYVQSNLAEGLGATGAVAVTSLLFAGLHALNPHISGLAVANLILAGLLFGAAYQRFRTLWAPWTMHLAWNFTQGTVLGVAVSGTGGPSLFRLELTGPAWWTGGAFGFEGGLACTAVIALATLGFIVWRGRAPRPAEPVGLDAGTR